MRSFKLPKISEIFSLVRISRSTFIIGLFSVYVALILAFITYHLYFAKKISLGVAVSGIDISGKTLDEALNTLQTNLSASNIITIKVGDEYIKTVSPSDIDYEYLYAETVQKAFEVTRNENFFQDLRTKLQGIFKEIEVSPSYEYSASELESLISQIKMESISELKEPEFVLKDDILVIVPGTSGEYFDEDTLKRELISKFSSNDSSELVVKVYKSHPNLTVEDLDLVKSDFQKILNTPFVISYSNMSWPLTKNDLMNFLYVEKVDNTPMIKPDEIGIIDKLTEIASEVNRSARGQVLEVEGGKAVNFVSSQEGRRVKIKESTEAVKTSLLAKSPDIKLAVQVDSPPKSANEFGINEVIGEGRSRFKGSDKGRIHNIDVASGRISGTLIPPGEVFSFNQSVGEISQATGYTTAWIISKGRTILGDGGGVCQVSTTVFRAALDSGLPIVKRNAHSYRVSYYEQDSPVGLDATVYNPTVDLQFKNDTKHYILIMREIDLENYSLIFKIYGTDDGRKVVMTDPKVLSRTPPPDPIYEEDANLAHGVTKQVEYPIWGASVVFTRTVSKDDKVLYNDTFKSNYRAWGAVYKVGP